MAVKKKTIKGGAKAWGIGGAVAATALAAAASAYLLSDKKTKAKAKKWVDDAKKEIVKHAKTAKKLGKKEYGTIVDQVVRHYGSMENLTAADIMKAGKELKGHWDKIQAEAKKAGRSVKTLASKKKSASAQKAKRSKKARQ